MSLEDTNSVQKLMHQLGYEASVEEIQNRFTLLQGEPYHAVFVLENQGIQGCIHLEKTISLLYGPRVQIRAFVVDEKARGKGFGKSLLSWAKNWAKNSNVSTIYLSANISRDRSHAFYLQNGFTKTKTSHFFEMNF